MVREHDDSWGVDESVGATALGTAAVRAFEAGRDAPLFDDPYSQKFLDAATERGVTGFGGVRPEEFGDTDRGLAAFVGTMTDFAAARTKYFDDALTAALRAGVRQFAILAAGLDTRAWRLAELSGSTVYEIDQPGVLRFKADVLSAVTPVANYVAVPMDLRHDWPDALREAGFQPDIPTGWAVEGLLPYLPPDAQTALFENICAMSVPGSRVVVDTYRPEFYAEATMEASFAQMDKAARAGVPDDERVYSKELFFTGDRPDAAAWFCGQVWQTTAVASVEAMAGYGRPAAPTVDADALSSDFLTAWR